MPSVSVIIFNYNHGRYLPESLEAILTQSWPPKEVVVVDDASTDNSCDVVRAFQKRYSNLKLIQLEKNSGGPMVPMHEGLKHVTGDYLALCASDDIPQPGFFEEIMKFVTLNPGLGLCSGKFCKFDDVKPYQYKPVPLYKSDQSQVLSPADTARLCQTTHFYIPSHTVLYRRDLVVKYGGYDLKLKALSDFYLNCQIAFRHRTGYIPKTFAAYRMVPESYGKAIRYKIRLREQICKATMAKLNSEDAEFKRLVKKSGILAHAGIYMVGFLAIRPWYWGYFLPAFLKRFFIRD